MEKEHDALIEAMGIERVSKCRADLVARLQESNGFKVGE